MARRFLLFFCCVVLALCSGVSMAQGPACDCAQAGYRLVTVSAGATFICDGDPRNEIVVNFFATDPPSLIAQRGDSVAGRHVVATGRHPVDG